MIKLISSIRELKYQTICNQIMMESCTAKLAQAQSIAIEYLKAVRGLIINSYELILTRLGSPGGFDDDDVAFHWNHGGIQRNAAYD